MTTELQVGADPVDDDLASQRLQSRDLGLEQGRSLGQPLVGQCHATGVPAPRARRGLGWDRIPPSA